MAWSERGEMKKRQIKNGDIVVMVDGSHTLSDVGTHNQPKLVHELLNCSLIHGKEKPKYSTELLRQDASFHQLPLKFLMIQ
jgi:hypothetical protein